jgi:hypothetical protein
MLLLLESTTAKIGGFLHVLNAAHPVLSNQATTAAQNAVVQEPSHKKMIFMSPV